MSIVEGNHLKLKKELISLNLNIHSVYISLKQFWKSEERNYKNTMADTRMRHLNRMFQLLYNELITYVTPEALHQIVRQSDLLNRPNSDCKG